VLSVEADRSRLHHLPAERDKRLNAFRDVRTATVTNAGHMMQRHQPDTVATILTEHLG